MKKSTATVAAAILVVCLHAFRVASGQLFISDLGNGNVVVTASPVSPLTKYVLQATTDFTHWAPIATNIPATEFVSFEVPKTNSFVFFRVYH